MRAVRWGLGVVLAAALAGCMRSGEGEPCELDGDCADVDTDDDRCTRAACSAGLCVVEPVFNALCECFNDSDCPDEACAVGVCADHQCSSAPKPAGPLATSSSVCAALICDGVSTEPVMPAAEDLPAECQASHDGCRRDSDCADADTDDDPCTRPACSEGLCVIEPVFNALCECFEDSDCEGRACAVGTCRDHQCTHEPKPAGPLADDPGDCEALVCDGVSAEPVVVPDLDDAPEDTVADCRRPLCDQAGGIRYEPDGSDVPADEPGDCRVPACDGMTTEIMYEPDAADLPADELGDCRIPACDGMTTEIMYEPDAADLPADEPGDCRTPACDGVAPRIMYDPDDVDLPEDGNDCTSDACSNGHVVHDTLANGTECNMGGGFCFRRACETSCQPQDPAMCGLEGSSEPDNDAAGGAAGGAGCGMLDAGDVDWYSFYANDGAFTHDVLRFTVWTSAASVELCAYVACSDGTSPGGGCSEKLPGPSGSSGCCWTGSAGSLTPSWDLDCGTSEDSGTVYYSVRSTTAGGCAQYAAHGRY